MSFSTDTADWLAALRVAASNATPTAEVIALRVGLDEAEARVRNGVADDDDFGALRELADAAGLADPEPVTSTEREPEPAGPAPGEPGSADPNVTPPGTAGEYGTGATATEVPPASTEPGAARSS